MPESGSDSYFIIGVQDTDWDTPAWDVKMERFQYEMISSTLKGVSVPIVPIRLSNNPSPLRQIKNQIHGEGDIAMHLHVDNMYELWVQLMQAEAANISSTGAEVMEVYGDTTGGMKEIDPPPAVLSLDTQPNATDPTSDPGRLQFLVGETADSGVFTIAGKDQNDAAITDTVVLEAATTGITTKHFKTVNVTGIATTGFDENATGLYIESDKDTYTHVIKLGDNVLKGLTIEEVKGVIPSVYVGSLINAGAVGLGDTLTLTASILAKQAWNRYKVAATTGDPVASVTGLSVSGYDRVPEEVFPAWGLALYLEGATGATPIETASFALNNQLAFPARFSGVRTRLKPTRSDFRDVSLVATIDYDKVNSDYDLKMLHNQVVQARLLAYYKPYEGAEYSIQFDFPSCQIQAFPDPDVSDFSQVVQELSLNPTRSVSATGSDEVQVTLVNKESGKV